MCIDGVLRLNPEQHSYGILVYDNVLGGVDYVKQLPDQQAVVDVLKCNY